MNNKGPFAGICLCALIKIVPNLPSDSHCILHIPAAFARSYICLLFSVDIARILQESPTTCRTIILYNMSSVRPLLLLGYYKRIGRIIICLYIHWRIDVYYRLNNIIRWNKKCRKIFGRIFFTERLQQLRKVFL